MLLRNCLSALGFAAITGLGVPTLAHEPAHLKAELNFEAEAPGAEAQADRFYESLDSHDGQIIFLDLTIRPANGDAPDPGFGLAGTPLSDPGQLICGPDRTLGLIDNVDRNIEIATQHPLNNHAPTLILVGDRLDFPHQHISCSSEGYTEHPMTPLRIKGYFAVQSEDIPTAREYRLTPANAD